MKVKFKVEKYIGVTQEDEESWDWSDIEETDKVYELDCDDSGALNEESEEELWKLMRRDGFLEDDSALYDYNRPFELGYYHVAMIAVESWDREPLIRLRRIWED